MAEHIQATTDEIIYVTEERVSCDGPKVSKHPRVYLTVSDGKKNEVVCPYCGRIFRKESKKRRA